MKKEERDDRIRTKSSRSKRDRRRGDEVIEEIMLDSSGEGRKMNVKQEPMEQGNDQGATMQMPSVSAPWANIIQASQLPRYKTTRDLPRGEDAIQRTIQSPGHQGTALRQASMEAMEGNQYQLMMSELVNLRNLVQGNFEQQRTQMRSDKHSRGGK